MIREYRAADRDDLLKVWAAASAVAHPFLSPEVLERERHSILTVFLPIVDTWIWESEGRVVGFVSLLGSEVGALFVDPEAQRAGIGRALISQARASRGDLEVEVFKDNAQGMAFYTKCGFTLMHRKVHEPTGLEMLRLRLAADMPLRPADRAAR